MQRTSRIKRTPRSGRIINGFKSFLSIETKRFFEKKKADKAYDYHCDQWDYYDDKRKELFSLYQKNKNESLDSLAKYLNVLHEWRYHFNCMAQISRLKRPLTKAEERTAKKVADDYMKKHYGHFYKNK